MKNNILLILCLILTSCSIEEQTTPTKVYFCPQANCSKIFIQYAETSDNIRCAFYDLELTGLIETLNSSKAKIIIHDKTYYDNLKLYKDVDVKKYSSASLMHNKFCVFDSQVVITGSFNPTIRGNTKNNNNIIVINSTYIAENYLDEFNELWHDKRDRKVRYPKLRLNNHTVENYFCPEDCRPQKFTKLIDNANHSVYFMTFSFTRDDLGNALNRAHKRGVEVKGLFEKTQNNRWLEYDRLKKAGLNVKWDNNPYNMHHKVFIIDNKTVITGSMNPSNNGLERNDENVLILHNERIAKEFLEEFECVWARNT